MNKFGDCFKDFCLNEKVGLLKGHLGQVNCIQISAKDDVVISGGNDCFLNFWDNKKGVRKKWIDGTGSGVTALVLNEKENEVFSGHKSGEIQVYDVCELKPKYKLIAHTLSITSLIIYATFMLISSSWDGTIRIWNLFSRVQERVLKDTYAFINTLCVYNTLLVSGSDTRCLSFWDLTSYKNTQEPTQSEVYYLALSPKFSVMVSGHRSGEISFWDLAKQTQLSSQKAHSRPLTSIKFHFSQLLFFTSSLDGTIKQWDLQKQSIVQGYDLGFEVTCMVLSKYSNMVFTGSSSIQVAVLNYTEGHESLRFFHGHTSMVHRCIWLKKDECLITGSFDGSIRIWDLGKDIELYCLIKGSFKVWDIAANDTNTLLVAGCSNKTLYIWDLVTLKLINKVTYTADPCKVLLADDSQVLSFAFNNTIIHWKHPTNTLKELYPGINPETAQYSIKEQYLVISISITHVAIIKLP